jgi:hypothetical protein
MGGFKPDLVWARFSDAEEERFYRRAEGVAGDASYPLDMIRLKIDLHYANRG